MIVVGVVAARLDTFRVKFYFFSPYLFFQPTASSFFYTPVSVLFLCFCFVVGTKHKKQRNRTSGVVAARLDTFGIRISFLPFYIILLFYFFFSSIICFSLVFLMCRAHKEKDQREAVVGVVTARFDTFGVTFYLFFSLFILLAYGVIVFFYSTRYRIISSR